MKISGSSALWWAETPVGRAGLLEAGDASVSRNISHFKWSKVQSKHWESKGWHGKISTCWTPSQHHVRLWPQQGSCDFAAFWLNIARMKTKTQNEECYCQFSAKNQLIPTKWCFKHSIALQSIGKGSPRLNASQQKWNIPQAGWPLCNLTFATSPTSSTLHFNSLEMYLALTLSESVMLSGSNVFQTKTNKTKGNQSNLERVSNYYKMKERASKDETIARTGEHWTTSDVLLAKTIYHKKRNPWDRRADSRNTKHSVQNSSDSKIQGHTFPRTPGIPLSQHCSPTAAFPPGSTTPVQLSRSQHWTQATLQIPHLSQEKSVRKLLLGATCLFILLSRVWTLLQTRVKGTEHSATNTQEWHISDSDTWSHLPEFPSLPHLHQLHLHPRRKGKQ